MFSSGPKIQKLKTNLRLSMNRLKLLEKKKTEQAIKARKEIADFLGIGKEERARIRVEHIVREDYMVEGMELVEMYCDLLLARMGLIETTKELDPGLEEPIASILWASPRLAAECQELNIVSEQLTAKYGKEFAQSCRSNQLSNVNEKLMHKLSIQAPPKELVEKYLEEIAHAYNVPFTPQHTDQVLAAEGLLIDFNNEKRNGPGGGSGGGGGGGGGMTAPNPNIGFAGFDQPQTYPPSGPAGAVYPPPAANQGAVYPPPQQHTPMDKPPSYSSRPASSRVTPPALPPNHPSASAPNDIPTLPDIPDLPAIPQDSVPGGASVGGESVDFDDLTKRFEELKKRK